MRKEKIAKAQVIAGIVLIVLAISLNIILFKVFMGVSEQTAQSRSAFGYDLARTNQTSTSAAAFFSITTLNQWLASFYGSFCIALLLDLVLLAQAVMFILMGMRNLAKE